MEFIGVDIPIWTLLMPVALLLLYIRGTKDHDFWTKQGISGPKPLPFLGSFREVFKSRNFTISDRPLVEKYGKIFGAIFGTVPVLFVADPEFLRLSYIKEFSAMPNRRRNPSFGGAFDSMMTVIEDDHWRHVRNSLTPTFTSGKLKSMKGMIDKCCDRFKHHLEKCNGKPFQVNKYCGAFTMDVIASTAFGLDVDTQENPDSPFMRNGNRIMNPDRSSLLAKIKFSIFIFSFMVLPTTICSWVMRYVGAFDQEAVGYFAEITRQSLQSRDKNETNKDFIQLCRKMLVEAKAGDPNTRVNRLGKLWTTKGLTEAEILGNGVLFFIAGYDTTASTLQYLLYMLALHPEIQQRVYEEMTEVCSSDSPSYEEVGKCEYLDRCLQETLRLYPAAGRIERQVKNDITINGIHLTKNNGVIAMVYAIHRDPEYWPEPDKFDPERFTPENKEGQHPYAWIPFGLGNRNCIGMRLALMEMKLAAVKVVWNFELSKCDATQPPEALEYKPNFRMDPIVPIEVIAKRRVA